jgi:aryl-alcohol dehydrogenase-like predicted oxidoreductase
MQDRRLGRSDLIVGPYCLGTMTFGTQTPPEDAHAQIERALDAGISFMDTAEMYPTNPVAPETVGRTEEIIGDWIARTGRRGEIVLATKVTGQGRLVRDNRPLDPAALTAAAEASLRRLRTDVIDLYQLHWPDRGSYHFRQRWRYDPSGQDTAGILARMEDLLGAMDDLARAGKVRAFGLSNDTAWGTAAWLRLAEKTGGPRMASIQNEYSLLCREFDTDLAELSIREEVPLLAYSPLAAGLLTGKYRGGAVPEGSRMSIRADMGGRATPRVWPAIDAYHDVARRHGLDPIQMALAFCASRPFMGSVILGASTLAQLEHALGAVDLALPGEVLDDLAETHKAHPLPY